MCGMNGWLLHNRHTEQQTQAGKTHKHHVAFVRKMETRTGKKGQETETGSTDRNHVPEVGTGSQRNRKSIQETRAHHCYRHSVFLPSPLN